MGLISSRCHLVLKNYQHYSLSTFNIIPHLIKIKLESPNRRWNDDCSLSSDALWKLGAEMESNQSPCSKSHISDFKEQKKSVGTKRWVSAGSSVNIYWWGKGQMKSDFSRIVTGQPESWAAQNMQNTHMQDKHNTFFCKKKKKKHPCEKHINLSLVSFALWFGVNPSLNPSLFNGK